MILSSVNCFIGPLNDIKVTSGAIFLLLW